MSNIVDLELNAELRKVTRRNREIKLSAREFDLLLTLFSQPGKLVPYKELMRQAWQGEQEPSNVLDVYMRYLSKKIDANFDVKLVHHADGVGYLLGVSAPMLEDNEKNQTAAPESSEYKSYDLSRFHLAHTLLHDLAQPLTSLRCFLEIIQMSNLVDVSEEAGQLEFQADRSLVILKAASALTRETSPKLSWPVSEVLADVLNEFQILMHIGILKHSELPNNKLMIADDRSLKYSLSFIIGKLFGRCTHISKISIGNRIESDCCIVDIKYDSKTEIPHFPRKIIHDATLSCLQTIAGDQGHIILGEQEHCISIKLPLVLNSH